MMFEFFTDHTFRTVFLGTAGIGAVSGAIGCFAYLRRQSLIGDVVAHSSLLGIMVFFLGSYLITGEGSKSLMVLIPGALIAGVASLILTRWVLDQTRLKPDSALGVMLAIFFGSGILLLRWTQRATPNIPGKRGLEDYLFGMAAAMTNSDLWMIGVLGVCSVSVMLLMWKEFKIFTFDPVFAQSTGLKTTWIDTLMLLIMVIGIVIGIQSVGVVLMIALLVTPASSARQWTGHLGAMVILAAFFGAVCGGAGSVLSASFSHIPTGPVIVLVATVLFVISLTFAPKRGLIARLIKRRKLEKSARVVAAGGGSS
jgi:manganese/zinc/iron transport system permease protein